MVSGREPRVAVVGATGTVGGQIVDLIVERDFPCAELRLFASQAGSSDSVESAGRSLSVHRLNTPADLAGCDLAFLAVPEARALEIVEEAPGPILIDLSASSRPPAKAPMIAPGLIARERVQKFKEHRLIAVPHPAAQAVATIVNALAVESGFAAVTVISGASAGGREQIAELFNETADLLNARLDVAEGQSQLAFNLFIPDQGAALANAIAAQIATLIGGGPDVAVQFLRAPAFHGQGVALGIAAPHGDPAEWTARMRTAPGILFIEGDDPAGFVDAVGQEALILRMRQSANGAVLWCVFDGARIAAATALWIAESIWFSFS